MPLVKILEGFPENHYEKSLLSFFVFYCQDKRIKSTGTYYVNHRN